MSAGAKKTIAIAFVIAALGYAGYSMWSGSKPTGGSERDLVALVCKACQQDSEITSAEFAALERDPSTLNYRCPRCGEPQAVLATMKCYSCNRYIPPQPMGAAMVCPHCGVSLEADDVFDALGIEKK